ncbi:MAG: hypothetical protein QOC96_1159 [Acidobacteriota bacterium]|jgi:hypothetical protein|nr:hypothetical protein [Acidobacteriota bacterium]
MRKIFLAAMIVSAILVSLSTSSAQSSGKASYPLTVVVHGAAKIKLESGNAKWVTRPDSGFGADFTGASHFEVGGNTLTVSKNQGDGRIDMDIEVDSETSSLTILITDLEAKGGGSISSGSNEVDFSKRDKSGRIKFPLK